MKQLFFILSMALLLIACKSKSSMQHPDNVVDLQLPQRPNILWLVTEDMGHYIPSFGDSTVETPNLSRLAQEGIVYPNLFSVSGVCAPSRSAIATGVYPSGIGTNHMRTTSNTKETGLPRYEGIPSSDVKMVSEMLRASGYYCSNNYKEDYQFRPPATAWDESSAYAHWRNKADDQPFFAVFNFTETHESGLFEPYGFRHIETRHYHEGDRSYKWADGRMTTEETPVHLPKDTPFDIPPYLPNTPVVRHDMWKLYNNICEMDKQVGAVLKQLEDDGYLENTIVFFYGDHGGPLPREKRLVYDSGLNTPLIIRYPKKQRAGSKDTQLISFVDFAPTLLSLVGIRPPEYMQGQAFVGQNKAVTERKYIHAAADRFDEVTDAIRAVRDERFKYIRNYRPEQQYYLPLAFREKIPCMQELLRMRDSGELNEVQAQWFRQTKSPEELFDCEADPHELNNLAEDPAYTAKLEELSAEMDRWLTEIGDQPNLPEAELIAQLWEGQEAQPQTAKPEIKKVDGELTFTCATEGASIAYQIITKAGTFPIAWSIYQGGFSLPEGASVRVKAHRIGFKVSETLIVVS